MTTIAAGKLNDKFTVQDFAAILHVHPVHLTNVVKIATGRTPCSFYKEKLTATAKTLLADRSLTISEIAYLLTFDTSNFSKFFKRNTGLTPKKFRENMNMRSSI